MRFPPLCPLLSCLALASCSPSPSSFIRIHSGTIALTHVRIIDGTGVPAKEDQTIVIDGAKIRDLGAASAIPVTGVSQTLDLTGHTIFPGLVGMHEHLFYALPPGQTYVGMQSPFARLYLAAGVTSARTAGTLSVPDDAKLRARIESGAELGPHLYLSSHYIEPAPNS